jgi:hypothetical protein
MPRYFFDLEDGHRLVDRAGLECSNDAEALAKAVTIARQVAADAPTSCGRRVAVVRDDGRRIGTVKINEDPPED